MQITEEDRLAAVAELRRRGYRVKTTFTITSPCGREWLGAEWTGRLPGQ